MWHGKHSIRSNRRGSVATAVAVVLAISGASLIGVSIASQRRGPQAPPLQEFTGTIPTPTSDSFPFRDPSPGVSGPTLGRSLPVSMDIPSIGVHSKVQDLGQAEDGSLEAPAPGPHYDEAAWYRYSPTPGSLGPAILLGHVDSASDGPSVFYRLGELRRGDQLSVTRADGSVARFEVDEVHRYAKDNFPTKVVYNDIDHAGLRIVTCGGAFDDTTGHYLDNIVVFARLVGSSID